MELKTFVSDIFCRLHVQQMKCVEIVWSKLVHCEIRTVVKRTVGIRLKCSIKVQHTFSKHGTVRWGRLVAQESRHLFLITWDLKMMTNSASNWLKKPSRPSLWLTIRDSDHVQAIQLEQLDSPSVNGHLFSRMRKWLFLIIRYANPSSRN